VKVFIDECVDWRLARDIVGHEVKTAHQMGWSTIENGELLVLAAKEFDVFVTVDRNLSFQQHLPRSPLRSSCCAPFPIASPIFNRWYQNCWRPFLRQNLVLSPTWESNSSFRWMRRCHA
jgi:hypothetical protein